MKKTLLLGVSAISLMLFSCGETTTPEELDTQVTEITTALDEVDAINAETEVLDEAEAALATELEDLDI